MPFRIKERTVPDKYTKYIPIAFIIVGVGLLIGASFMFINEEYFGGIILGFIGAMFIVISILNLWNQARSRALTKHRQQRGVIESYLTTWHRIDLTDTAVQTKKRHIPYSSIIDCSFRRTSDRQKAECVVTYSGSRGSIKKEYLKGLSPYSGLDIYTKIVQISRQYGYKITQQPNEEIVVLSNRLRKLNIESDFIEPDVQHNRCTEDTWHIDHGGLKPKHININEVKVSEDGQLVHTIGSGPSGGSRTTVKKEYYVDFIIQLEPVRDIDCIGRLEKKSRIGGFDYHWQGTDFADILNKDTELRTMLIKAKVPTIEVKGKYIRIKDDLLPNVAQLKCIDRVVGHLRQAKI